MTERKRKPPVAKAKSLDEERLVKARADKLELEIAIKSGDLIKIDEIEKHWLSMALSFRNKMLALPSSIAAELADMNDPNEIETRLKIAVNESLEELAGQ